MIIKRKYFSSSDKKKERTKLKEVNDYFRNNDELKKAIKITSAAGAGSTVGSYLMSNAIKNSKSNASDSEEIKQKLLKIAKDQGTDVIESDTYPNGSYIRGRDKKRARKYVAKKIKKWRKSGFSNEAVRKLSENNGYNEIYKLNKSPNDAIILGKDGFKNASALSHELGHSIYSKPGRKGGIIGKTAHKIYHSPVGNGIGIVNVVNGFNSGVKAEKAKLEGKKESKLNRARSIAVPLALSAPMLISEGAASVKGLKLLKQSGASKKLMQESKRQLATAFGSYAMRAGGDVVMGEASRLAGKGWIRHKHKGKEKD